MPAISQNDILRVLNECNPWWKTGMICPRSAREYHRFAYHEATKRLNLAHIRRFIILNGLRRVGKTTIQYQMIESLLKNGVSPTRIVYVPMEHPMLELIPMGDILDCYHENIHPDTDCYYFFDEVQYAQNWDKWMKTIYDMQPDSKLIATSSVSVTTARESGIGRFSVIQVPLLSFYEYCELLEIEKPVLPRDLNVTSLLSKSQHERNQIMLRLSKVTPYFFRYLQIGGFPELACADNDWIAQQIVREDVVDKVLKRDIPALYPIRYPLELQRLFLYLCNVSSQLVSIEAIFKELQSISRPTIEKYISYLESANLIYQSWPICIPGKPVLKVRSKIYIADAAIRNAIHMNDAILTDPDEMERIVETAVFRHVAAFYSSQATAIGYYQGCGKNKDVAVEYPDRKNILIEVRYRKNVETEQEDEIYKLSGDAPSAIVVTKNLSDFGIQNTASGGESLCIPVAAFLYVLGHAEKNGYQRYQI